MIDTPTVEKTFQATLSFTFPTSDRLSPGAVKVLLDHLLELFSDGEAWESARCEEITERSIEESRLD